MKIEQKAEDVNALNTEIYIPIKDLVAGRYAQIFLLDKIIHTDTMITGTGSPFARIILKDITGQIEGVIWNYTAALLQAGNFYYINLETEFYRGLLEFSADLSNIFEIEKPPLNINDYIKGVSESELISCASVVEDALDMIDDEHYRNIIGNAVQGLDLIHALKTSPYGLTGPLAYRGGLLVHVAGSLKLANVMIEQAKIADTPINTSLVIASCILRNIGWHTTMCFINGYPRPKDAFYMTGINRASARYVDHLMIHVESDLNIKVPEAKKQALENSCNEVADIKTIEGRIAAMADDIINLLHFGGEALHRKTQGNWTEELFTGHNT